MSSDNSEDETPKIRDYIVKLLLTFMCVHVGLSILSDLHLLNGENLVLEIVLTVLFFIAYIAWYKIRNKE